MGTAHVVGRGWPMSSTPIVGYTTCVDAAGGEGALKKRKNEPTTGDEKHSSGADTPRTRRNPAVDHTRRRHEFVGACTCFHIGTVNRSVTSSSFNFLVRESAVRFGGGAATQRARGVRTRPVAGHPPNATQLPFIISSVTQWSSASARARKHTATPTPLCARRWIWGSASATQSGGRSA